MYRAGPTRNFCRQRKVQLDCYGDPDRVLYRAVGLELGGEGALSGEARPGDDSRRARWAIVGAREGR